MHAGLADDREVAQHGVDGAERVFSAKIAHRARTTSVWSRWFGTPMGAPVRGSAPAEGAAALTPEGSSTGGCPFHAATATITSIRHGASGAELVGRIKAHMAGIGIGKRRLAMPDDNLDALRKAARDALAETFAPIAEDIHRGVRKLNRTPLDELELAGGELRRTSFDRPLWQRYFQMRTAVAGSGRHFDRTDHALQSDLPQFHAPKKVAPPVDTVVPVGEHGEPMARAIGQAARAINAMILRDIAPVVEVQGAKHAELLRTWTFMDDMTRTVIEGTNSFAGVAGILTSKRVPGMSGVELLERLDTDGLFARVAAEPNGITGPLMFTGYMPKTPLAMGANGRLKLSTDYEAIVDATRRRRDGWLNRMSLGARFDKGCPLLKMSVVDVGDGEVVKRSYIRALGSDFVELTKRYYERELAAAGQAAA